MSEGEKLIALAERCEAATGADRELDAAIIVALDSRLHLSKNSLGGTIIAQGGFRWMLDEIAPKLTASLDAALALVGEKLPKPWGWDGKSASSGATVLRLIRPQAPVDVVLAQAIAATPALALCAALLRALAQGAK